MLLRLNEDSFANIINEILKFHDYMPETMLNHLSKAIYHFESVIGNLSSQANLDNYENALFHVLEMLNKLDDTYNSVADSQFSKEISI
jgi:flagellin-specific chaperone FliS